MMRFLYMLACAFALGALPLQAASAQEAPWRVTAYEGAVRVTQPGTAPAQARVNENLRPGAVVTTGADSRATLENGLQRVVMSANSRMTIAADSTNAMTRVIQDLGSLLFEVDRRDAQHFRVETPLLAAVVKGTSFTVSVTPQQDVVHVSHGLVEVRAHQGGVGNDVAAGATARVQRDAPGAVSLVAPSDSGVAAVVASLPAMDYAATSGGLIEAPGARAQEDLRLGANANGLGSAAAGGANAHAALVNDGVPGREGAGGLALGHVVAHNDNVHSGRGQPANPGNGNGNGQGGQPATPGGGNGNGQGGQPANPGNGQGGQPAAPGGGHGQGGQPGNPGHGNPGGPPASPPGEPPNPPGRP